MPTPREIMEAAQKRILEQAKEIEQDMRDLERIVSKYKLLVVAPPESYTPPPVEFVSKAMSARAQMEGEALIRTAGHPMTINELFHNLLERGVVLGGSQPTGALSSSLIKNPRLRYIPKLGWWLRDVSWPPKPNEIGLISNPPPQEKGNGPRGGRRRTPEKEELYQALRDFLEGKPAPTPFREIYAHLQQLGIPLSGKEPKQNLSAFMTSIHEFRSHGPNGRGGWTFTADNEWDVLSGFKGDEEKDPAWRHNPMKFKLYEVVREILKGRTQRMKFRDLFAQVKAQGVDFTGVKNHESYLHNVLHSIPCFVSHRKDESGPGGWVYVPELDQETST